MLNIAAALAWTLLLTWFVIRRRFLVAALALLLFSFSWRLGSSGFIDLAGPIYSSQLQVEVGPGRSMSVLWLAYTVALLPYLILFPGGADSAIRARARAMLFAVNGAARVSTATFMLFAGFVAFLYADMLRIGIIPLFEGMERFDYARDYGGIFHSFLFKYLGILVFPLGVFASYPILQGKTLDRRFVLILLAVMAYAFLTGHRFSAFLVASLFFVAGAALAAATHPTDTKLNFRPLVLGAAAIIVAVSTFAIWQSYFVTRAAEDEISPLTRLTERVLIQQGELWTLTFERVFVSEQYDTTPVLHFLFEAAIDEERNTTTQYLMWKALGDVAVEVVDKGQQYVGGFPEIFFEIAGPIGGWPLLFVASAIAAIILREIYIAIAEGRLATALTGIYVFYAFFIMYVGGMLNFLVAWTFWVKVSAFLVSASIERLMVYNDIIPLQRLEALLQQSAPLFAAFRSADGRR